MAGVRIDKFKMTAVSQKIQEKAMAITKNSHGKPPVERPALTGFSVGGEGGESLIMHPLVEYPLAGGCNPGIDHRRYS